MTPASFADYLHDTARLGERTIAQYVRLAARWGDGDPRPWLADNLPRQAPAGTRTLYVAAAKHWLDWKGETYRPKLDFPRASRTQFLARDSLTDEELAAYYSAVDGATMPDDVRFILRLLPVSGLRISEACGLPSDCLDARGRSVGLRVLGKGEKTRFVTVPAEAMAEIEAWAAAQPAGAVWLFPSPHGAEAHLHPETVRLYLREIRTALPGYASKITPHVLRHTYCTALLRAGERMDVVQALMGHKNASTTLRYTHPAPADLSRATGGLGWAGKKMRPALVR